MTRLVVQAAWGQTLTGVSDPRDLTWTDITRYTDVLQGARISRGASDERSDIQPTTCGLVLNNADGRFSPGRAASPYYPHVVKNVPLRVQVLTAAKNLVQEGSFEEDPPGSGFRLTTGWAAGDPEPRGWSPGSTRAHHGASSLEITWEDTAAGTGPGIVQHVLYGLTIGQTYTASGWVWVPAGDPAVRWQIDGGTATGTSSSVTAAWQQITLTFTATAPSHTLQITATGTNAAVSRVWLDEVQVEEGSAPTAFSTDYARLHPRFLGVVNDWPTKWKGLYATTAITCTDVLKLMARQRELQAMLIEEVLLDEPLAYYPLSEPADSTSAGDIAGHSAGALALVQAGTGGTLVFGADVGGPATGLTVPEFAPSTTSNGLYLQADLGPAFEAASIANYLYLEGWFSTTTRGRVIYGVGSTSGRTAIVFTLDAVSGQFTIEWTIGAPTLTVASYATGDLANGDPHHFVYDEFNQRVYVDGTSYLTFITPMTEMRLLRVGAWADTRLWQGSVSHVALHAPPLGTHAPGDYTSHYTTGTTEHIGEGADERMARLARYAKLGVTPVGSVFDGMASQRALGRSPLEHMREIEATESGKLFASRGDDFAELLTFQSRDVRFNPVPLATLDYADLDTDNVEISDDDQKMVNTLVASRPGGATQRLTDETSRTANGIYQPGEMTLLKTSDGVVADAAQWIISRYADPPPEVRQVPVEASTLPLATYRALLDADISSTLQITGLPDEAPSATATVTVEGYTETIRNEQHDLDFHTSRAQTDGAWVLDDPAYSVLGGTTRLAY